jgi:polyisoprenoid-binding protein YceI
MELNRTITVRHGGIAIVVLLAALHACTRTARQPTEATPSAVPFELPEPLPSDAQRYRILPDESLVSMLVYRGGKLASAGHNHVIASHEVSGSVAFTPDVSRSVFVMRVPVGSLSVDEPELRRASGDAFSAAVPESAREGTRQNMLSAALLDAQHFPDVTIRSQQVEPSAGGAIAHVEIIVRDQTRVLAVPLRYEQKGEELLADGEFAVRQTELGLTPFSALLGALQVQDEMRIRFRLIARAEPDTAQ